MDDKFLHQLRREPPTDFATRLKSQLDRSAPTRPHSARWITGFAVFGAAFALVAAPSRHALLAFFESATISPPPPTQKTPISDNPATVEATDLPGGRPDWPRTDQPLRSGKAAAPAPALEPPAPQPALEPQPVADAVPSTANTSIAPIAGLPTVTPAVQAKRAVETRQALFRILSLITQPLDLMVQGRSPVELNLARISAIRLQRLAPMIPEVMHQDTRAISLDTRALENIWNEPADFQSKTEELTLAANALDHASETGDEAATLKAIVRIDMTCTACHDVYRKR
jgi:cytochrome c556